MASPNMRMANEFITPIVVSISNEDSSYPKERLAVIKSRMQLQIGTLNQLYLALLVSRQVQMV